MGSIKIGFVSDVQYADIDNYEDCYYRKSLSKLSEAVHYFNSHNLDFVIQLGDFIEKDWESFNSVFDIWNKLDHVSYHVLGNHDFEVIDSLKLKVPELFSLKKRYYSFQRDEWNFIFLDGNDLSLTAFPKNSEQYQKSKKYFESFQPKSEWWNGGIGNKQMSWLKRQLSKSQNNQIKVMIFCHFPIYPNSKFCLWNKNEVMRLISKYSCVKVWMNGHHHIGSYGFLNNIHFITFRAMVDLNDNSFGIINTYNQNIEIDGFGREMSRSLKIC